MNELLRRWKNGEAFANLSQSCHRKKIWNRLLKLVYMPQMVWENRQVLLLL